MRGMKRWNTGNLVKAISTNFSKEICKNSWCIGSGTSNPQCATFPICNISPIYRQFNQYFFFSKNYLLLSFLFFFLNYFFIFLSCFIFISLIFILKMIKKMAKHFVYTFVILIFKLFIFILNIKRDKAIEK